MKSIVLTCYLVLACDPSLDLKEKIDGLVAQREQLTESVNQLIGQKGALEPEIEKLRMDHKVMEAERDGHSIRYVLRLSIRQIHYSISIRKQIADAANEEEFQIYTDRTTYENSTIGQSLFESFRTGSAIMKGSLGTWRIKIVDKKLETL